MAFTEIDSNSLKLNKALCELQSKKTLGENRKLNFNHSCGFYNSLLFAYVNEFKFFTIF